MARWMEKIMGNWSKVEIQDVRFEEKGEIQVGSRLNVAVDIFLGPIRPEDISLDVYYGEQNGGEVVNREMVRLEFGREIGGGRYQFQGAIPCRKSGKFVFGTRVMPHHSLLPNPYFLGLVFWG